MKIIDYILANKEWIFSGCGVAIILFLGRVFFQRRRMERKIRQISSRNSYYAEGDILLAPPEETEAEADQPQVSLDCYKNVDWKGLLGTSSTVETYFVYASGWRSYLRPELIDFSQRRDVSFAVYLADYEDHALMLELSRRFNMDQSKLIEKIREAESDLDSIFRDISKRSRFELYLSSVVPVFSMYRFDNAGVLSLYTHKTEKGGLLTYVDRIGSPTYTYISSEFKAIRERSRLRIKYGK
jgi:hypothetical protein